MKSKILSLVIAATMLFGTASVSFAATADDLQAKLDSAKNELTAAQEAEVQNADEIAELEATIAQAENALYNTNATVKATVKVSKTTVTVSWTKADTAKDYDVVLYRNGKAYKSATTTGTSYTWKNVTRGCEYKATVVPVAEFEAVEYEGNKAAATAVSKLSKATLKVKKTCKKVKVTSAYQNSPGFQIYISKDKKFKKNVKKVKVATKEKALNKKLSTKKYFKSGKNYIKVRAYTKVNGKTVYGKWSKVKTVKK